MSADPLYWLPADYWNEEILGRRLPALTPLPGAHCTMQKFPGGTLVSFDSSTEWRHPWFTEPKSNGDSWTATVCPGFVNGIPAAVPLGKTTPWLTENPDIPLSFRMVGEAPGDPVPVFFKALGVTLQNTSSLDTGGIVTTITDTPADVRYLAASDLYVSVARPTYSLSATVSGNLLTGQLVDYSVGYDQTVFRLYGTTPRLRSAPLMPDVKHLSLSDRLSGNLADDGEDRQLVSTVYLLSPENPQSSKPDATWTPFVRHFLFWNVSHASRNLPPKNLAASPSNAWLNFYLGRFTVVPQATQGAMDALVQSTLEELYNSTANEGRFWT